MPGFVGFPELLLLGLVVLVLFGPKRLPEMGRSFGKGLREFKDSVSGDHKGHGLEESKLEIPSQLTAADTLTVSTLHPADAPVAEPVVVARREVA